MEIITMNNDYCRAIREAYIKGESSISLKNDKSHKYRLTRFRKSYKAKATGKVMDDGSYAIVFWDNLIK